MRKEARDGKGAVTRGGVEGNVFAGLMQEAGESDGDDDDDDDDDE